MNFKLWRAEGTKLMPINVVIGIIVRDNKAYGKH